jgi:hypothetical protein
MLRHVCTPSEIGNVNISIKAGRDVAIGVGGGRYRVKNNGNCAPLKLAATKATAKSKTPA